MSEDLAWAAGFMDGEGSFLFTVRADDRGCGQFRLSAGQSDPRPLERLAGILGGKVYGPYPTPLGRPHWGWRLGASQLSLEATEKLLPYLSAPKREQAMRAVEQFHAHRLVRPPKKTGPAKGSRWSPARRAAQQAA